MKKSELRQIIREEIEKLSEASITYKNLNGSFGTTPNVQFVKAEIRKFKDGVNRKIQIYKTKVKGKDKYLYKVKGKYFEMNPNKV